MLLGRSGECSRIDRLMELAREGTSTTLVLAGDPGIGKSALLRYAMDRSEGMTVLAARGVESESEISFSGLAELLRPVLHHLDAIPGPQAAAVAGALALGPPVAGDRFAVSSGTLSLIAAASDAAPVLGVVDDIQWLDAPSAEALLFAARRLRAERVCLLFAVRDGHADAIPTTGIEQVRLGGLDPDAAAALLRQRATAPIASDVMQRLLRATMGNPLALVEIPGSLTDAQLAGREPLDEPLAAGVSVERAFLQRVASLPSNTRTALLVAAASESPALDLVVRAAAGLGADGDALEVAESAGLVSLDGSRVEFRHPLVRSAVYHGAEAAARRAAHRALAAALAGHDRD
ncbi:MAG TPA: AAA family ATPase, partial [Solirubrobacteraceae bacterium]|nr:AAA family ATPase [Solirubrobacteraceae bacterium]